MRLRRGSYAYIAAVVALAVALGLRFGRLNTLGPAVPAVLLLALMASLFHAYEIPLPGRGNVSADGLAVVLAASALGPLPAVVVLVIDVIAVEWLQRRPWQKALFNCAQGTVAILVASVAFTAAGGRPGMTVSAAFLLPYYALVLTNIAVNTLLLATLFATIEGRAPWRYWVSLLVNGWPNIAASLFAGVFLQAIYTTLHLAGVAFIFLLLLGVRFALKLYVEAQNFYQEIVRVLTQVLELKDPFTGGHSERVAQLAEEIGREMGFVDRALEVLKNAALMHDVGKTGVPDAVLVKPGPLTAMEREQMDLHVDAGYRILEQAPHLKSMSDVVAGHHEHFDGSGYPRRVGGFAVPLAARIIAVADAYDAMTTDRPYRSALPAEEAMLRLREGAGHQFDPEVVDTLFRIRGYDRETGIIRSGRTPETAKPASMAHGRPAPKPLAQRPRPVGRRAEDAATGKYARRRLFGGVSHALEREETALDGSAAPPAGAGARSSRQRGIS